MPAEDTGKSDFQRNEMKTSHTSRSMLLVALLLAFPFCISAEDSVGLTVVSRGDVEITTGGTVSPLGRGDFVFEGARIVVGERSFAVLQFVDGAKLSLRPESSIVVERYRFFGNGSDTATLKVLSGGLRINPGAISSNNSAAYRIRTPSGSLMLSEAEGSLTVCGDEICDQQGLVELPD